MVDLVIVEVFVEVGKILVGMANVGGKVGSCWSRVIWPHAERSIAIIKAMEAMTLFNLCSDAFNEWEANSGGKMVDGVLKRVDANRFGQVGYGASRQCHFGVLLRDSG